LLDSTLLKQLATTATVAGIQQLVVGAVIHSHDKILLLRRRNGDFMGGVFELPSGKVEPRETLDEALRREVTEETGLKVSVIRDYLGHFDYTSASGTASRQFNFAVDVAATKPIVLHEHDLYQWSLLKGKPPVTDAVKVVLRAFEQADHALRQLPDHD
jgi:8-oxo-dGTP diphosphatase